MWKIVEKQSWIRFREIFKRDFDLLFNFILGYDDDEALPYVMQVTVCDTHPCPLYFRYFSILPSISKFDIYPPGTLI